MSRPIAEGARNRENALKADVHPRAPCGSLRLCSATNMGILYTVWPLDQEARTWLADQSIESPAGPARWPTRTELEKVLSELRGFKVTFTLNGPGQRWSASIDDGEEDGNWTLLQAEPEGDDRSTRVSFEKGEPTLIVAILRALSAETGPLMLVSDVGCPPIVVSTSRLVQEILADFCAIDEGAAKWQRLVQNAPGAAPTVY